MYGIKKRHVIAIILLLFPLFVTALPACVTDAIRSQAASFLKFPLSKINNLSQKLQDVISLKGYFFYQLKDRDSQIQALKSENAKMKEIFLENKRLQELLSFKGATSFKTLRADIISKDPTNWRHSIIINKGAASGVKKNMFVISPQGLAGRVCQTGRNLSKAILLTDPDFKVAAICQRSREQMIVLGSARNACVMKYLTQDADIEKGDTIVTSGLGGFCPKGILIGEVVSVRKSADGLTAEAYLEPSVRLRRLEEVLVLTED